MLGVHLGQYLIEMRLAEHRRPLSRAQHDQGCATDSSLMNEAVTPSVAATTADVAAASSETPGAAADEAAAR